MIGPPDYSMIGKSLCWKGDEATVCGPSEMIHGAELFPVRIEEGLEYGEVRYVSGEYLRPELAAARIQAENESRKRIVTPQVPHSD